MCIQQKEWPQATLEMWCDGGIREATQTKKQEDAGIKSRGVRLFKFSKNFRLASTIQFDSRVNFTIQTIWCW